MEIFSKNDKIINILGIEDLKYQIKFILNNKIIKKKRRFKKEVKKKCQSVKTYSKPWIKSKNI